MSEDQDSKTEQPTERRLQKAREEGQTPLSQEFKTWVMLVGSTAVIGITTPYMAAKLQASLRPFIEMPHAIPADLEGLRGAITEALLGAGMALAPTFALLVILALGATGLQTGFLVSPAKLAPKFEKISPMAGAKRLFGPRSLIELFKGVVKLTMVGTVGGYVLWAHHNDLEPLLDLEMAALLEYLRSMTLSLLTGMLAVITLLAAADFAWQRFDYFKKMRMTKQEVRDEHKQSEGDPLVKGRIRQLRMERARRRMMAAVPQADVVITNPTHYAVALKYDMERMNAPVVVAKGVDLVAKRIRDVATEHKVAIVENPPLARALYASVDLDQEIPPEHYKAVAEVIGYVMRFKGKLR